jgi:hypothetical protein
MKLSTHITGQVIAGIIQLANLYGGIVPAKYQPIVVCVVGVCQAVMGLIAHYSPSPSAPQVTT